MHIFLSNLAQGAGLLVFVAAFGLVLWYALSPRNKTSFERAAQMPLDDDETHND